MKHYFKNKICTFEKKCKTRLTVCLGKFKKINCFKNVDIKHFHLFGEANKNHE